MFVLGSSPDDRKTSRAKAKIVYPKANKVFPIHSQQHLSKVHEKVTRAPPHVIQALLALFTQLLLLFGKVAAIWQHRYRNHNLQNHNIAPYKPVNRYTFWYCQMFIDNMALVLLRSTLRVVWHSHTQHRTLGDLTTVTIMIWWHMFSAFGILYSCIWWLWQKICGDLQIVVDERVDGIKGERPGKIPMVSVISSQGTTKLSCVAALLRDMSNSKWIQFFQLQFPSISSLLELMIWRLMRHWNRTLRVVRSTTPSWI